MFQSIIGSTFKAQRPNKVEKMQTKITIILLVFWSSGGGGLELFKHKKISVAEPLADPDPACFNWHAGKT